VRAVVNFGECEIALWIELIIMMSYETNKSYHQSEPHTRGRIHFILSSLTIFRVRTDSVTKLNWKHLFRG
jgi:hypothetical protein